MRLNHRLPILTNNGVLRRRTGRAVQRTLILAALALALLPVPAHALETQKPGTDSILIPTDPPPQQWFKLIELRDAKGQKDTIGWLYADWRAIDNPFRRSFWAWEPRVFAPRNANLDAAITIVRDVVSHMCFTREFCGRTGGWDGVWRYVKVTGNADLGDFGGLYRHSQRRIYLSANGALKDDVVAHELGHLMDRVYADDRLTSQDLQGNEVEEALADMFAYDYDRLDATYGEDDGSPNRDWANPGSIMRSDEDNEPYPDRMSEYKCNANSPYFNSTILSHAYWRFVQKVGHDVAGRVLQYIPWYLGPKPRFIDVYRGFAQRGGELYPHDSAGDADRVPEVREAATRAFRDEVGIGRDVPTRC